MPTLEVGMWSLSGFYFNAMKWVRGKFRPHVHASVNHDTQLYSME